MKKYHNMTGEGMPFTSGERASNNYPKQEQNDLEPIKIGKGILIMFCVFVIMVVAIIYQDNRLDNLRADLKTEKLKNKKQQEVIIDLQKLYSNKK